MKKLILFLLAFTLIFSVYSQENLRKVIIDDFSEGQNSNDLADIIKPNQGVSVKNVKLNSRGKLSKRNGQAIFLRDVGNTAFTGLGRFDPDVTTSYLTTMSGASVQRATVSANGWTTVGSVSSSNKTTEFVQALDLLFVLNGADPTSWWTGSQWVPGTTDATSPPTASTGSWLQNYLFLAGNDVNEDWIYFSNNLEPLIFDKATDILKINTGDGQEIIRVEPFRLFELIVYKERSIHVLDIEGSTPLSDWIVQPIATSIGCVALRSVVNIGNDHWFLSSNPVAIRSLVRSNFDKILLNRVSDPIQDIFNDTGDLSINTVHMHKSAAILFDNKYVIAIPTGISTTNNTVLVFDFVTNAWSVIEGWNIASWVIFNNDLYGIDSTDAKVMKCFSGTTGDYGAGPGDYGTSDPSVAIAYEFVTKDIDFGESTIYKELDALELEFGTTGDYNATVFINLDDEGFQQIGTVNLANNVLTLPFNLPATLSSGGVAIKLFDLEDYGEFRDIKVKVTQDGLGESVILQSINLFARLKPWRRD